MPTAGRDGQSWQLLRTGRAFRGDSTEPLGTSITLEHAGFRPGDGGSNPSSRAAPDTRLKHFDRTSGEAMAGPRLI